MIADIAELLHKHPQLLCVLIPLGWFVVGFILKEIVSTPYHDDNVPESGQDESASRSAGCFLAPIMALILGTHILDHKVKKAAHNSGMIDDPGNNPFKTM